MRFLQLTVFLFSITLFASELKPVMSLDFAGTGGQKLQDRCGNFQGDISAAIEMIPSGTAYSAKFNGVSSWIELQKRQDFKFPEEYSVEIAFTPSETQTSRYPKLLSLSDAWCLHITKEAPFTLCLNLFNASGEKVPQLVYKGLNANEKYNVIFSIGRKEAKLYVNRKLADSCAYSSAGKAPSFPLLIGNRDAKSVNGIYSGLISHIAIYEGVATASSIAEKKNSEITDDMDEWSAEWIWDKQKSATEMSTLYFFKKFDTNGKITAAQLKVTADDQYELYLNGQKIASDGGWVVPEKYDIKKDLRSGTNVLTVKVDNFMGPGGLLAELDFRDDSGNKKIISDNSWKYTANPEEGWKNIETVNSNWENAVSRGKAPCRPWGPLQNSYTQDATIPVLSLEETLAKIKAENLPDTEIKNINGMPSMLINGKPVFPMLGKDIHLDRKFVNEYGQNGIHLYVPFWPYVGLLPGDKYDYSEIDAYALTVLSADPDAYMMFFVYLEPADFWKKSNPEELCKFSDGTKEGVSLASAKWKKDYGMALEKFIEHIEKSPYRKRIFGIIVEATLSEWQYWGVDKNKFPDYSEPVQEEFRRWVHAKYKDIASLQKAWNNQSIKSFDAINIPSESRRRASSAFTFLNPATYQDVIDYLTYHSELVADSIIYFSEIVKRKTSGKMICGTFYGYLLEHGGMGLRLPHGGHLALRKVLDCPDIDFVGSPVSYRLRMPGHAGAYMIPKDSVYLHKKMLFHEADMRTCLMSSTDPLARTRPENIDDTISVLKREFAKMLTDGIGLWWYDMRGGWFSDKAILNFFKEASTAGQESLPERGLLKSEIAVIADEKSAYYMSLNTGCLFDNEILSMQRRELSEMGIPYDTYLLSDLLAGKVPDYKMYVMLNPFRITEKEREILNKELRRNGHTVIWFYAPGFIGEKGFSADNCEKLCGIKLKCEEKKGNLNVKLLSDPQVSYGMAAPVSPLFSINDPDSEILGHISATNEPGLGVKKFVDWTSVYCKGTTSPHRLKEFLSVSILKIIFVSGAFPNCGEEVRGVWNMGVC